MLIDWAHDHDRIQARMQGRELPDPYGEYLKLKAMEPEVERMHNAGQLREYKYRSYRETLDQYERQLNGW